MYIIIGLLVALTVYLIVRHKYARWRLEDDPIIHFSDDDESMNAAIERARKTLPQFWQDMRRPALGQDVFGLKVRITDGKRDEFFWLGDLKEESGQMSGMIDNEPRLVGNVEFGQRYTFSEADIVDWMYIRHNKMYGNFTTRVMIDRMPKSEAEKVTAMLAFEPQ